MVSADRDDQRAGDDGQVVDGVALLVHLSDRCSPPQQHLQTLGLSAQHAGHQRSQLRCRAWHVDQPETRAEV